MSSRSHVLMITCYAPLSPLIRLCENSLIYSMLISFYSVSIASPYSLLTRWKILIPLIRRPIIVFITLPPSPKPQQKGESCASTSAILHYLNETEIVQMGVLFGSDQSGEHVRRRWAIFSRYVIIGGDWAVIPLHCHFALPTKKVEI